MWCMFRQLRWLVGVWTNVGVVFSLQRASIRTDSVLFGTYQLLAEMIVFQWLAWWHKMEMVNWSLLYQVPWCLGYENLEISEIVLHVCVGGCPVTEAVSECECWTWIHWYRWNVGFAQCMLDSALRTKQIIVVYCITCERVLWLCMRVWCVTCIAFRSKYVLTVFNLFHG